MPGTEGAPGHIFLRNEFAAVEISVDISGLGPRLTLTCLRSERRALIDPIVLAAIAAMDYTDLISLCGPEE
jgi:hypothetical protein